MLSLLCAGLQELLMHSEQGLFWRYPGVQNSGANHRQFYGEFAKSGGSMWCTITVEKWMILFDSYLMSIRLFFALCLDLLYVFWVKICIWGDLWLSTVYLITSMTAFLDRFTSFFNGMVAGTWLSIQGGLKWWLCSPLKSLKSDSRPKANRLLSIMASSTVSPRSSNRKALWPSTKVPLLLCRNPDSPHRCRSPRLNQVRRLLKLQERIGLDER